MMAKMMTMEKISLISNNGDNGKCGDNDDNDKRLKNKEDDLSHFLTAPSGFWRFFAVPRTLENILEV